MPNARGAGSLTGIVMPEKKAHPLNVAGPFYVEDGCCLLCDVPRGLASDMFKFTRAWIIAMSTGSQRRKNSWEEWLRR